METIKAKKSGRWAQDDPAKKQIVMMKGRKYDENDVPVDMMERLVGKGFAEYVKGKVGKIETGSGEEELVGIRAIIAGVIEGGSDKNKKKDLIEVWTLENLKIDIDKRKSLEFLIEQVVTEHETQNG